VCWDYNRKIASGWKKSGVGCA